MILDSDTTPRDRRAELEAAVVAAGKDLSKRLQQERPVRNWHDEVRIDFYDAILVDIALYLFSGLG